MDKGIVIIGAGQGGLQTAISLRQEGYGAPITLIGAEPDLPYQRPPLSKAYLKDGDPGKIQLRPESYFVDSDVSLRLGQSVTRIDPAACTVSVGGEAIVYDHLVLATGTRNAVPPIRGVEKAIGLRTRADADRLRDELAQPRDVFVIGGGFIGLEFAAVAAAQGHHVTVAEAAPRVMARVVSPEMSKLFHSKHAELGVQLHLGQPVQELRDTAVVLADGSTIPTDLIVLAAGVVPNSELAAEAGLHVENGIVVDSNLRTSAPNVFALGDCARFPEPLTGEMLRLESVQAAMDHARLIAKVIVEGSAPDYGALPWFWSDQSDWKLQIAGIAKPENTSHMADDMTALRFDAADRLICVETINAARTHMVARRVLAAQTRPSRADLGAHDFDLAAWYKASA